MQTTAVNLGVKPFIFELQNGPTREKLTSADWMRVILTILVTNARTEFRKI